MRKFIMLFCFLALFINHNENVFAVQNDMRFIKKYDKTITKKLSTDLAFSEMQIFHKISSQDKLEDRISRLEIEVYGAIQEGSEEKRIKSLKKAVTNISSGGNGLQYNTQSLFGINNENFTTGSWNINHHYPNVFHSYNTHRIPTMHHHSHIIPPPPHHHNETIPRGNYTQNYSLGTSIKILDD